MGFVLVLALALSMGVVSDMERTAGLGVIVVMARAGSMGALLGVAHVTCWVSSVARYT